MAFLRNTQISTLDAQLMQTARTDVASSLFQFAVEDGELVLEPIDSAGIDYFVAVYGPTGQRIATGGGDGTEDPPIFPASFPLTLAVAQGVEPFTIPSSTGGAPFHASVSTQELQGTNVAYTQLIAMPTSQVNRLVGTYIGIYLVLAVIIIVAGALLTRWLVTLTFRSLGQVEATAMSIAAGDFGQRMTDIEPRTEVGRLKAAINTMLGRVDAAISQRDATVQQMRRFIGDASHELRTPLVTVRGYAELYRMGAIDTDEDVAQAMERIEKEAVRMGLLVEDLLALARLDERRDVAFVSIDLRPLARDAALDVRAASPGRTVTVIDTTAQLPAAPAVERTATPSAPAPRRRPAPIARAGEALSLLRRRRPTDDTAPLTTAPAPRAPMTEPIVLGDENRIRQVIANLLGNARRFTAETSPIELRIGVDSEAGAGWIEVVDHGEGVPDQIKEKIFQRFWRADTSRARETGGTGLGLSIVASVVEALHGSVAVLDTPGGGATFRVSIPLDQTRDAAEHLSIQTQPLWRPQPPAES
ncbi:sensor histidine kinase [Microbacterium fluvii]|uniref:histidine kinase n=1 Tax=Microbacterium fluvii TaxID=415215 RepID=A0ABW2H9Y6_9MICO|nr:HAMP domain-containing sensor histidine kinase [Microbacterium fluvii]MCU4671777.1 HAMP domain-containing histidine kinase [Microbacterium fluvii]